MWLFNVGADRFKPRNFDIPALTGGAWNLRRFVQQTRQIAETGVLTPALQLKLRLSLTRAIYRARTAGAWWVKQLNSREDHYRISLLISQTLLT